MNRLVLILVTLSIVILPIAAQTSSLQGIVQDAQGAVVPGALVILTNEDTAAVRRAVADNSGAYSVLQVQPGTYKVETQKPGFAVYTSENRLQVNEPAT